MGWCSGTPIFDKMASAIIHSVVIPEHEKVDLLDVLINAMEDHDWDCQSDSQYYDHPLVQIVMRELHPDWFEDDDWEDE